jgi:hypothetical protein
MKPGVPASWLLLAVLALGACAGAPPVTAIREESAARPTQNVQEKAQEEASEEPGLREHPH